MTKIKGGTPVVRQNFSMHPDLVRVFLDTATKLNAERADLIVADRSTRLTYSKVAAAIAWHIKGTMLGDGNELSDQFRKMVADYEASPYENTDLPIVQTSEKSSLALPSPSQAAPTDEEVLDDDDEDDYEFWAPGATS